MGKKSKSKDASKAEDNDGNEKGSSNARPGTSGTENLLMTSRKEASEQFAKAHRAEMAYRTKKRAALARANYNETKTHFKEAFSHLKLGMKGLFSTITGIPHLVGEKQELRRRKTSATRRQRDLERKKKIEEALARQSMSLDAEVDTENKPEA